MVDLLGSDLLLCGGSVFLDVQNFPSLKKPLLSRKEETGDTERFVQHVCVLWHKMYWIG